jgi:hypothetical protein
MSELIEIAKQHISNVSNYVLSVEYDRGILDILAIAGEEPEYPRYQFINTFYQYRNLREYAWGPMMGRIGVGDVVEITERTEKWGKIGMAWLKDGTTDEHRGLWVYMGSMIKL